MTYIEELKDVIRRLHGPDATQIEGIQVKETFEGSTVWEGVVEFFQLHNHPMVSRVYAWAHDTNDPQRPRRHVTVLHLGPVTSAAHAVRASIIQEFRSLESESEA